MIVRERKKGSIMTKRKCERTQTWRLGRIKVIIENTNTDGEYQRMI